MIFQDISKYIKTYKTKIGNLTLVSNDNEIINILFGTNEIPKNIERKETKVMKQAINEIEEYLIGKLKTFKTPVKLQGTDFQKKVWQCLRKIPYGETRSYKDIAEKIGCPKGYQAVGSSNGKNPIPIIIPCHRVIKANGDLGGFSAGLEIKMKLLNIENNN